MNYVEFKVVEGEILCTYVNKIDGEVREILKFENETAKSLFKLLNGSSIPYYQEEENNGINRVRFYNINIELLLKQVQKNIASKVTRKNKILEFISDPTVIMSAGLALLLFVGASNLTKIVKKEEKDKEKEDDSNSKINTEDFTLNENSDENSETLINYPITEDDIIIPDDYFDFDFEDRSQSDKAIITREKYYDVIKKYSERYGLPTNLMVAVATQERGLHSDRVDAGGGFGLFQIQSRGSWNWLGNTVDAINFETGEREYLRIGERPDGSLDENVLANLEYNVRAGCMIMAKNVEYCNGDLICALQCYNSGNAPKKLKSEYGEDWVNHRQNLLGDPMYIEHVLSFIGAGDNILEYMDSNFNEHSIGVYNINGYNKTLS